MLRVKVQSCKWECLLCARTFSTKFCYVLHCKNVHGKSHEDSSVEVTSIVQTRPQESSNNVENNAEQTQSLTACEEAGVDEAGSTRADEDEIEKCKRGAEKSIECDICKKTFSNVVRLNGHKNLHAVPVSKIAKRSHSSRISNGKENKKKRKKAKMKQDENGTELINKSKNGEQDEQIQGQKPVDEKEAGDADIEDQNSDHFYSTSVQNSKKAENEQSISSTSEQDVEVKGRTEINEVTKKNGNIEENPTLNVKNSDNTTSATVPRRRGRPRKEQTNAVTVQKAASGSNDKNFEQNVVFPCPDNDGKDEKKCGSRKKTRECDICHKIFANRSSLREHRRIHTGEKPFICAVCDKGFIRMGHLKQHMCSHTGLWPFKCGACGKGFMNPSRVTRHMRVHNDERPNICDQCGESFKEPHHLARHMHLHSGVKPFKCPICEDRYFIQAGNLKIHMKTHESEMTDSNVTLDEISHEIVASTSQIRDENASNNSTEEHEAAVQRIITVSEGDIHENVSAEKNRGCDVNSSETNSDEASKHTEDVAIVNEIVLQIVPGSEHNVQVHGLQGLASIDQELLRQYASSIAEELAQAQQQ